MEVRNVLSPLALALPIIPLCREPTPLTPQSSDSLTFSVPLSLGFSPFLSVDTIHPFLCVETDYECEKTLAVPQPYIDRTR